MLFRFKVREKLVIGSLSFFSRSILKLFSGANQKFQKQIKVKFQKTP